MPGRLYAGANPRGDVIDQPRTRIDEFLDRFATAFAAGEVIALGLRAYAGADETLKSIDAKPALIKGNTQLSVTWHYRTRDIVKNFPGPEAREFLVGEIGTAFRLAQLYTAEADVVLDLTGKSPRFKTSPPSRQLPTAPTHDRQKVRPVAAKGQAWLRELGLADDKGQIVPSGQDKYRQINRYVEILGPLLREIPKRKLSRVVDMGAGKGYLTFAVADFLASTLQSEAEVVGVELRPDLVSLCNDIAVDSGLGHLHFEKGAIGDFDAEGASALIALHACDTATDDALAKGIAADAELIVVAPCCHKQIRREIEAARAHTPLDYLTRHGIFLERQAEMVTDAIRALVLEHFGYRTKVFEFVSDVHTPKNVLIVGQKSGQGVDPSARNRIAEAKAMFGIRRHYLEDATGL